MTETLEKFVSAQNPVFERVLEELRTGRKKTHWMWFVFPQIAGLGRSAMSKRYALASLNEARAYLSHDLLGMRLKDATKMVLAHIGPDGAPMLSVGDIFGWPDKLKFHSSMTLFDQAASDESLFKQALNAYFDGQPDNGTIGLLASQPNGKDNQV